MNHSCPARRALALGVVAALLMLSIGCGNPSTHPGQLNATDGATFDTLTVARSALLSMRPQIATTFQQYIPAFNIAASSYTIAYTSYVSFRNAPNGSSLELTMAIANLTSSIISLEDTFAAGMHAQKALLAARNKGYVKANRMHANGITFSDILTELMIAASVAAGIPGTQPYSNIALFVIEATRSAVSALSASQSLPIDLLTLTPLLPLP